MSTQPANPEIENYKRSYDSMWAEIGRLRADVSQAFALVGRSRDLILALEHDMGTGTKISQRTHEAFRSLRDHFSDNSSQRVA